MADRIGTVPAVHRTARCHAMCLAPGVEGMLDLPAGDVVLAINAVGVDGQQHGDAVHGSLRDLGGGRAGVHPEGQGGVPQVVGRRARAVAAAAGPSTWVRAVCQVRP
jgi:hypothetical protein